MQHPVDPPITSRERRQLALVMIAAGLATLLALHTGCHQPRETQTKVSDSESAHLAGVSDSPSTVYMRQAEIVAAIAEHWAAAGVEITQVTWRPCGEENAYYKPGYKQIELCTEMSEYPDAAQFFAAHEAGHAVAFQLAGTLDEAAADAIGALEMIRMDRRTELLGAALYHRKKVMQDHTRGENHPGNGFRSHFLACMEDGSEDHPASEQCRDLYRGTKLYWDTRLNQPQVGDDPTWDDD